MSINKVIPLLAIIALTACTQSTTSVNNITEQPPVTQTLLATAAGPAGLMAALAKQYHIHFPQYRIGIVGSDKVPEQMIKGQVQMGIMERRWTDEEVALFSAAYGRQPIAAIVTAYAAAIYVNKDNPLSKISVNDLTAIYGSEGSCGLQHKTQWAQIEGYSGDSGDSAAIHAINFSKRTALNDYLKEHLLCNNSFASNLTIVDSFDQLESSIKKDVYAIGYGRLSEPSEALKKLVIIDNDGNEIRLSQSYALSGRYPLAEVFYIYLNPTKEQSSAQQVKNQFNFVNFIVSQSGQAVVEDNGFITLPKFIIDETRVKTEMQKPIVPGGYR